MTLPEAIEQFRAGDRLGKNKLMADFCGVSANTATRWNMTRLPVGEPLIRLRYLLEEHGIVVSELKSMKPEMIYVGRLFAFGVLDISQALAVLRIENAKPDYLWRALLGKLVPSAVRGGSVTLKALRKKYSISLAEAKRAQLPGAPPAKMTAPEEQVAPTSGDGYILITAALISGLRPLVGRVVSDGPQAIDALRSQVGDDGFYAVLDGLKAMSSRRAHTFYKGEHQS